MKHFLSFLLILVLFHSCKKSDFSDDSGKTRPRCISSSEYSQYYTITGPDQICVGTSATYTIPGFSLAGGGYVNWSVDQPGIASIQANGTSVTVTRLSMGAFNLKAKVWSGSLCSEPGWLNDKGIENCEIVSFGATRVEDVPAGYIPSIAFFKPGTFQVVTHLELSNTYSDQVEVPKGTYNMQIFQTNNEPLTVYIDGYPTITSNLAMYYNVHVDSSFPFVYVDNQ